MGYKSFLFQFGNFIFPNEYIEFDNYDIAPDQRQDLDSFTDGNGETHRNALEHTKSNITFTTIEMSGEAMAHILLSLQKEYINPEETDANCVYFNPRLHDYKTGHFYLDPSVKFRIKKVDKEGTNIKYGSMQWIFVEY